VTLASLICIISVVQPYQIAFADRNSQRVTGLATIDTSQAYKIVNQNSGLVLGILGGSQTAGATAIQSIDNGTPYYRWHFIPDLIDKNDIYYKIKNLTSSELLSIKNGSGNNEATVIQWADNGADEHLWQLSLLSGTSYSIVNKSSGLALGVPGDSRLSGAVALQSIANNSNTAATNTWKLVAAGAAYANPSKIFGNTEVHDPSMIKTTSGTYYVFSTGANIRMLSSNDGIHFSATSTAFTTAPSWTNTYKGNTGDIWAPDISYHNNKYWLYYSVSTFGSQNSAIGLATSTTAAPGSWTDQGLVFASSSPATYNAIDPCLVIDASGNWWLSFGSYWDGIYMIQIDPSTGKQLSSNTQNYHLAKRLVTSKGLEASYIYPHGGYYYLFASIDICCKADATYHTIVGRSTSITGPYTDAGGLNMLDGGGSIILSTHGNIVGPGGASIMDSKNGTMINYHYYDASRNGAHTLGINLIGWNAAGWPYIH